MARTVSELMRRRFIAVAPSDSLLDAQDLMRFARVRELPVVERGRLLGVVAQRDVLVRLLTAALEQGPAAVRDLRLLSVRGALQERTPTVDPDASLRDAAESLLGGERGFVAVVDSRSSEPVLVGLLTESDLLRSALEH